MKKIIILILVLIMGTTLVSAQDSVANFPGNLIRISLIDQEPNPVKPGELMDIRLRVEAPTTNSRVNDFKNLEVTLIEDSPFSVDGPETKYIGTLKESEVRDINYRLRVASNAPDGLNRIRFKYSSNEFPDSESIGFIEIDVRSVEAALAVTSISTDPNSVKPGHEANLTLMLRNAATSSMRDISVELDLKHAPFTPLGTTAEKAIRQLNPGEEVEVNFNIIADTDAESQPYKIPLIVNFLDDQNNKFNKNDTIGLLIYSEPELELNIEDSEIITAGNTGEVTISVSNTGPSEVKFITLNLLNSQDYDVISTNKNYMGNLDSDDFQTAAFNIHINNNNPELDIELTYKDTYNKDFKKQIKLPLKVYDKKSAATYGLISSNGGFISYLIYLILIMFVLYTIQGWRTEKSIDGGIKYGLKKTIRKIFRFIFWFRLSNLKKLPSKIKKSL